jgi:hypothetical protein
MVIKQDLENTLEHLIKNGFRQDKGVTTIEGTASDIVTEIALFEGRWLGIFQRLDNE